MSSWSVPAFEKNFEATRFQQGNDAIFRAVVSGQPTPVVIWTKKGQILPCSEKYQYNYDPKSGQILLRIKNLGPGDEGQYCCTVGNDYGNVTATLNVNPDVNAIKHRALMAPGCCRASLQRKMMQKQKHGENTAEEADYENTRDNCHDHSTAMSL